MRDVAELISRIEELEGPSDLIDAELYATIGGAPNTTTAGLRTIPLIKRGDPDTWPAYTASLDAAVALVERVLPGWSWECRASGTGDRGQATVWNPSRAPGNNQEQRAYNCASPSIALILALLRTLGGSDG